MTTQSSMHFYFNWAKERLDEMEATLGLLEGKLGELRSDARAKAESAIADMSKRRDAFRDMIRKESQANEATWSRAKTELERDWSAFEADVQKYVDLAGKQVEQQQAAFRARAEAQRKAWQEASDKLFDAAAGFAADRRADVESAVKRMKNEAEAAGAQLESMSRAGTESWSALSKALAESRAAFDRANQAVHDAIKRAG